MDNDVTYAVTNIVGDTDILLESGELKLIAFDRATGISPAPTPVASERFAIKVQTPVGATIDITRQVPAEIEAVMPIQ